MTAFIHPPCPNTHNNKLKQKISESCLQLENPLFNFKKMRRWVWFCLGNTVRFAVLHNIINHLIINNKTAFNQTKKSNGCIVPSN